MTDLDTDLEASDAALFANGDWRLLADGLEHRATGYFIDRDALPARRPDGLWAWPLHLAEKRWCTPRLFREAFLIALDRFGHGRDEALSRSFAVGFGMRAGTAGQGDWQGDRHRDGFVALGELVRPKPASRERPAPAEGRPAARGRLGAGRLPVGARA